MSDRMPGLAVLILAAGRASRMRGADKLLKNVLGQPVLRHLVTQALGSGLPVFVALPQDDEHRRETLVGLTVRIVEVADPSKRMSASLAAGIAALPRSATGVVVMLADMPEVTSQDIADLAAAFDDAGADTVIRGADAEGRGGHPVILPARLFPLAQRLSGDSGGRDLLRHETVRLVTLPGRHATLDLDTPEDWAEWSAGLSERK